MDLLVQNPSPANAPVLLIPKTKERTEVQVETR